MKIMFMGTPDFARIILKALYESGHDIVAVMTQPDKPKGRGYTVQASPVKIYAENNGLKVYQPNTLRGDDFMKSLSDISPELIVVAAYGNILPKNVLDFPEYGCINVHGSLLPKYRGAAPIQRAIMNGEKTTGITIIQMDEGIDTGDMLLMSEQVKISNDDNFQTLHDKLADAGGKVLLETITRLESNLLSPIKQNDDEATYAPKIEKNEYSIDFSLPAENIHNKIRSLSPFPLAYSVLNGKKIKFISSAVNDKSYDSPHGTVVSLDNGVITISCGRGSIDILVVLPEGKNKMKSSDFINGRKINIGDVFEEVQ